MSNYFDELTKKNKLQIEEIRQTGRERVAQENRIAREKAEEIKAKQFKAEKEQDRAFSLQIHNEKKRQEEAQQITSLQGKKYEIDSKERIENKKQWLEQSEAEKAHFRQIEILNGKLKQELKIVETQESYSLKRTNKEWNTRANIERQKGQDLISVETIKGQFLEKSQKLKNSGELALSKEQTQRETAIATLKINSEIAIQRIITSGLTQVEKEKSYRAITLAYIQAENEILKIKTKGKEERKTYISKTKADTVAYRKKSMVDMVTLSHATNLEMKKMVLASILKINEWEEEKRIFGSRYSEKEKEVEDIFNANYEQWKQEIDK